MSSRSARIAAVCAATALGVTALATPVLAEPTPAGAATKAKDPVQISAPATATQWKRFTITCKAPTKLVGGTLVVYQNNQIFNAKGVKVGSNGACNFWVKSGLLGINTFDLAVLKGGKYYQSNDITVTVAGA